MRIIPPFADRNGHISFYVIYLKWGGISSLEHDEAVMLEAAMFGVPEGTGYHIPFAPHHLMRNGQNRSDYPYALRMPRPPSPALTAQRLLREQQVCILSIL